MLHGSSGKNSNAHQNSLENNSTQPGPYFDISHSKNVTSILGKTTYLNCRVKNLGNKTLEGSRGSNVLSFFEKEGCFSYKISTVLEGVPRCSPTTQPSLFRKVHSSNYSRVRVFDFQIMFAQSPIKTSEELKFELRCVERIRSAKVHFIQSRERKPCDSRNNAITAKDGISAASEPFPLMRFVKKGERNGGCKSKKLWKQREKRISAGKPAKWSEEGREEGKVKTVVSMRNKEKSEEIVNMDSYHIGVSWVRHRDVHLLTIGSYTYTNDQRFKPIHKANTDDWTLEIKYPQQRDSGNYECQVSTTPHMSHIVHLDVIGESVLLLSLFGR
ncbi:hypothetical protein WH47_05561 [Habropoda laboriosa]|uniref:Ig-like domain-containing protein n=1 Tax=Habropoda laboriosa TaxID=597456 RepID=A0A0L7RFN5_9HYME|nr:hypothetical protein WH47_05561 [Habropoda laboriosa]